MAFSYFLCPDSKTSLYLSSPQKTRRFRPSAQLQAKAQPPGMAQGLLDIYDTSLLGMLPPGVNAYEQNLVAYHTINRGRTFGYSNLRTVEGQIGKRLAVCSRIE